MCWQGTVVEDDPSVRGRLVASEAIYKFCCFLNIPEPPVSSNMQIALCAINN